MTSEQLVAVLDQRILVLDGAIGTMLMDAHVSESDARGPRFAAHPSSLSGNLDILTLTQPALVCAVHEAYLAEGADIISTNTFRSDAASQAIYGLEALSYELNLAAARLARGCADAATTRRLERPRFVAGVIGPSLGPLVARTSRNAAGGDAATRGAHAYREQVRGLMDGDVDLLLVETAVIAANGCAAMVAIRSECTARRRTWPVMVTTTPAALGSHPGGARALVDAYQAALGRALLVVGLNCGIGSAGLADAIAQVGQRAPWFASCHPSAGRPQPDGRYPESPNDLARVLGGSARAGWLNIVGGCCGTTPLHIRALADAIDGVPPRPRSSSA